MRTGQRSHIINLDLYLKYSDFLNERDRKSFKMALVHKRNILNCSDENQGKIFKKPISMETLRGRNHPAHGQVVLQLWIELPKFG